MISKFQDELLIAIEDWADAYRRDDLSVREDRKKLESLIDRACDRTDVLCAICLDNVTNFPPGPGEPNINTYKKALELACEWISHDWHGPGDDDPKYWIAQASQLSDANSYNK